MKNINVKKLFWIILFFSTIVLINSISYAGEQRWNSLDFDVKLNTNGSMDVTETWDVYISNTNTLFKDYKIDKNKYSSITNVQVINCLNGTEIPLNQIYEEQYHVDPGCYYGMILPSNSKIFEIAWNVGLDNSSENRKYKISYTVNDVVKIYNDCTEVYWQFLGKDNAMTGRNVTGTITLPKEVSNEDVLRVWGHGNLSGDIIKTSNDTVNFSLSNIYSNEMLEIRIVTDENIYENCTNIFNKEMLESIINEENDWANEANRKRNNVKNISKIIVAIIIIIFIYFITKIRKYTQEGKELKEKYGYSKIDLKYFRDIPDEKNATPARACYMKNFKSYSSSINSLSVFSATILDLALKDILEFELISKKDINIIFKNTEKAQNAINNLTDDEKEIFNLLKSASNGNNTITIDEFNKYYKKHYEKFHSSINSVTNYAEEYIKYNSQKFDADKEKIANKWAGKTVIYFVLGLFIIGLIPISIEFFICAFICNRNSKTVIALTEKGYEEQNQWKALKNYMNDFSLLKDREVPDLILWEKYLVYATAFGISKKVMEQLKLVYPEILDSNYYYDSNYKYLYLLSNSNYGGINTFDNLTKSFEKVYNTASSAYNSAHYSDGSGGGGGFSGGGGGRRTVAEAVAEDRKDVYYE